MNKRILLVDDEENILSGYKRLLRGKYDIFTSLTGKDALGIIEKKGPFSVVVSDYKMPEMNGVEFLSRVSELSPKTVRVMLSGQADINAVIEVINKGRIFRFLTKPCSSEIMTSAINDAIEQYRLVHVEKELLEKTLSGSIKVLTDLLSLSNPLAFSRAIRVRRVVSRITDEMNVENGWQINVAALLSQVGCVTIPEHILHKIYQKKELYPNEIDMYHRHPHIGSEMIKNIPRLENVAMIIEYQEKLFNGSGAPKNDVYGEAIPFGARLLKLSLDYDTLLHSGMNLKSLWESIDKRTKIGWYDEKIVENFKKVMFDEDKFEIIKVRSADLNESMILDQNVVSKNGAIIASRGQEVTLSLIQMFNNFEKSNLINFPVSVLVPVQK